MITVDEKPQADDEDKKPERAHALPYVIRRDTPLSRRLTEIQASWLIDHLSDRWDSHHRDLGTWRTKMEKWERMSEGNYDDRRSLSILTVGGEQRIPDVFARQNETLGMSEGFSDFFTAQARNDIFGTKPWLQATPEGPSDGKLADQVTKHANWKLGQTDLEEELRDAVKIASWGGTSFVKMRWHRDEEIFEREADALHDIETGKPILGPDGDFITSIDQLPEGTDPESVEMRPASIEESQVVYDNVAAAVLDYKDVAFDAKAAHLDLAHTDFYSRFRLGLLDVIRQYEIPEAHANDLKMAIEGRASTARDHRGESDTIDNEGQFDANNANPQVTLIEGFARLDVMNNGRPVRIHAIFSPELRILFSVDYLAGVTPSGNLPVFPVRAFKIPSRILGIGYFEKYEDANNSIDRKHNAVGIRARLSSHVWTGFNKDALREPSTNMAELDPAEPLELANDKTLKDLVQFETMPEVSDRLIQLRDQEHQMAQMRSGITSAAQGELKGVPSASTAAGTNNIISRGAILLKDPVDQLTADITKIVSFGVNLIYANHDREESFTYGEGQEAELMTIKPGDVQGLRMNVTLTLVQAQNQQKLQSAIAAIDILTKYTELQEMEKTAARPLFVQAISALGFRNADAIIRQAVVDPAGILALVPAEMQQAVAQALQAAGIVLPPSEGQESAPVISKSEE